MDIVDAPSKIDTSGIQNKKNLATHSTVDL
jgi:hypothetical protein